MGKHSNVIPTIDIGEIKKEVTLLEEEENLIQSETIRECPNKPIKPKGRDGFVVIKVPVVLAEFEVEIDTQCKIRFDQPAVEILRIKKYVYLTECRLLPKVKKLFLKGFVRKKIEYAVAKLKENKGGNSVRQITVCIPFICTTLVNYFINPDVNDDAVKCNMDGDNIDLQLEENSVRGNGNYEYTNEGIYWEIVKSRVFEVDITEEEKSQENVIEKVIKELNEKLVIYLTLRLLQKQEINIYGASKSVNKSK